MTTIKTIQDLIPLLEEQPDLAEVPRGDTPVQRTQGLPAAARELAQSLSSSIAETTGRLANIEANVATLWGDVGMIRGAGYERRALDKAAHRAYQELGFLEARPVKGPTSVLSPILSSALATGRADAARAGRRLPDPTEHGNFLNSDIIIADTGDPVERTKVATSGIRYLRSIHNRRQ